MPAPNASFFAPFLSLARTALGDSNTAGVRMTKSVGDPQGLRGPILLSTYQPEELNLIELSLFCAAQMARITRGWNVVGTWLERGCKIER